MIVLSEDVNGDVTASEVMNGDDTASEDMNGDSTMSEDVNGDGTVSEDMNGDGTVSEDMNGGGDVCSWVSGRQLSAIPYLRARGHRAVCLSTFLHSPPQLWLFRLDARIDQRRARPAQHNA